MRSDIVPDAEFPDYVLPDHTKTPRRLSDLQSGDPMVLVLIRGFFCPKDRVHLQELARFYKQLVVGTARLVTITTDDWHTTNNLRQQLDAHWPFLYDEERTVQQDLYIKEYTDPEHDVMIPHTIVLRPGLTVHRVFNGYYYWGRPSTAELHQELREATKMIRADWDPHPARAAREVGARREGPVLSVQPEVDGARAHRDGRGRGSVRRPRRRRVAHDSDEEPNTSKVKTGPHGRRRSPCLAFLVSQASTAHSPSSATPTGSSESGAAITERTSSRPGSSSGQPSA